MGDESLPILRDVDLSIQRGEFVSIVGPSGSGKSTLLNVLGCLDQADSGVYRFDGIDISRARDRELARLRCTKIGFVFQSFHLIEQLSALQNVEQPMLYRGWTAKQRRARALALLAQMSLENRSDHRPSQMSGGQQQRVALARALANDPDVIIADEPTGNLDTATTSIILDLLVELKRRGKTIIVVTHDPHVAAYGDRTVYMQDGILTVDRNRQ
jgi:putative ABC transport system ATP-binding protein